MNYHIVSLAFYFFLARVMKMKLNEFIPFITDCNRVATSVIHLDGVAVVDYFQRCRLIVEADWRQVRVVGVANVDGRLSVTKPAGSVFRLQVTPMVWAFGSGIGPSMAMGLSVLCSGGWDRQRYQRNKE